VIVARRSVTTIKPVDVSSSSQDTLDHFSHRQPIPFAHHGD
jgi:hypothetical protein